MAPSAKSKGKAKANKLVDVEPTSLSQQSSSDDGMTAVLMQKIQSSMEKKKKDKEAKYLQAYQQGIQDTITRGATEYMQHCAQIGEAYDDFVIAHAKADDEIRAIWTKILSAYAPLTAQVQAQLARETAQDQEREEQHVLGLAYHRKSEDAFIRGISSLAPADSD